MRHIRPFYPQYSNFQSTGQGVVLFNHVGSSANQDTGRDAQDLANRIQRIVIAADRPGTATLIPRPSLRSRLADDHARAYASRGVSINDELERNSLSTVLVAGRSAAGLAALAITRTETLPVAGVCAMEAVGWSETTVEAGKKKYRDYGQLQARMRDDINKYPYLTRPHGTGLSAAPSLLRILSIGVNVPIDQYHYAEAWAKPWARRLALDIASQQPQVGMRIEFAEHSLTAPEDLTQLEQQLHDARAASNSSKTADITVFTRPNTTHSSFDNRGCAAVAVGAALGYYNNPDR